MVYGFVLTLLGIGLGIAIGLVFEDKRNKEKTNVWKEKYNLLKEMHYEQFKQHKDITESMQTVLKNLKMPSYIQCTIVLDETETLP